MNDPIKVSKFYKADDYETSGNIYGSFYRPTGEFKVDGEVQHSYLYLTLNENNEVENRIVEVNFNTFDVGKKIMIEVVTNGFVVTIGKEKTIESSDYSLENFLKKEYTTNHKTEFSVSDDDFDYTDALATFIAEHREG